MKTGKLGGITLSWLLALAGTAFGGDIYEIRPCKENVVNGVLSYGASDAYATFEDPMKAGEDLYFVVRLMPRSLTAPNWRLVHNDATWGSPTLDEIMNPLQIGIYVSGKLQYADLVETQITTPSTGSGIKFTDLVFKYTTKPGDFAMPVELAVLDENGNPCPAHGADGASSYVFNRLSTANNDAGKWQIRDTDNEPGVPNGGAFADLKMAQSIFPGVTAPWGTRLNDYTLKMCGFYIKTIDFDPQWEIEPSGSNEGVWRSVHESSYKSGFGSVRLVADSQLENSVKLYVWSSDESAVKIHNGKETEIITGYDASENPIKAKVQMAEVTVGTDGYGAFQLYGVAYPKTARLVLSAYPGYTYNSSLEREPCIEVPVACAEKESASVYVEISPTEMTADGDYETSKGVISVYLNQPVDVPVNVTLVPTFNATNGVAGTNINWLDYFRFSTEETVYATPNEEESTKALTVTFDAGTGGATSKQYIYVYPLRSDDYTRVKAKPIRLTPVLGDGEQAASGIKGLNAASFTIKAGKPVITNVENNESVESGIPLELSIALSDIYADITDESVGYSIKINGTTLPDKYIYKGEKLVRKDDGTSLPTVTYNASGEKTGTIQVFSPYGKQWSEIANFSVNVKDVTTIVVRTIDDKEEKYNEGDDINFQIGFFSGTEQVKLGQTAYAFLYTEEDIDLGAFDENFIITDITQPSPGTSGIKINKDVVDWTSESMMALDGANAAKNGAKYRFSIVLCSTKSFNPANIIQGYPTSEELNFRVYNVEPVVDGIYVNDSADLYANDSMFPSKVPVGLTRRFRPGRSQGEIDPGLFDLEATDPDKQFQVQWSIYLNGELYEEDPIIVKGNPNSENLNYTFQTPGVYTLRCKVKDKDMTKFSDLSTQITVEVLDQPYVQVSSQSGAEETMLEETKLADGRFTIGLDYFDNRYNGDIKVKVEVREYNGASRTNPGKLLLDSTYASADPNEPNVYYVTLNKRTKSRQLNVIELDGTDNSLLHGFEIVATVVNDDILPTPNSPASSYYLPYTHRVFISNVLPECIVMPEPTTNRVEVSGGAATGQAITWKVLRDVEADFSSTWVDDTGKENTGIKVTFSGGISNGFTTNVTSAAGGTFIPNFGSEQGPQEVMLTVEDKDRGIISKTWLFTVSPSKTLITKSTGPSGGSSTSALSKKYVLASGIGKGHTFVSSGTFAGAENFALSWNCGKLGNATVYAFGYKAGAIDDGSLNSSMDIAIDQSGNRKDPNIVPAAYYTNADEKDSFFYCFLSADQQQGQGGQSASVLNGTILPERPGTISDGTVMLPTDLTGEGGYLVTYVEAIFAKEWHKEDNLGDINQDGIPDVYVHKTWGNGTLIQDPLNEDLKNIASENPDGDLLPSIYGANGEIGNVGGIAKSYAPFGISFNNILELRGFGRGLNAVDLTLSAPEFTTTESNAYYVAVHGVTLAEIREQREADTKEPWYEIPADALTQWSPEPRGKDAPRLDPTLDDTDKDGFSDGWEYFFWYAAHVWEPGGGSKKQEGQKYPFERFSPQRLVTGVEIPASEVEEYFNPLQARDGDSAKDTFDFDNDGLTDIEEMIIGTNPTHWDSDGDHMCDGWEVMMSLDPLNGSKNDNADGDYMAYEHLQNVIGYQDPVSGAFYLDIKGTLRPDEDYVLTPVNDKNGKFISNIVEVIRDIPARTFTGLKSLVANYPDEPAPQPLYYGREDDWRPQETDNIYGALLVEMGFYASPEIPAGASLYEKRIVYIHDQVFMRNGFDPRTGWYINSEGTVGARWKPKSDMDTAGIAQNTRAYKAYDEYLLARYRISYGKVYPGEEEPPDPENVWSWFRAVTTNPSVTYEKVEEPDVPDTSTDSTNAVDNVTSTNTVDNFDAEPTNPQISQTVSDAFAAAGSNKAPVRSHGADTDGDGVPDGWELYINRNPVTGPGEEETLNPAYDLPPNTGLYLPGDLDDDGLTYALEFAGVDSCNAYRSCPTIYKNHPGNTKGWFNKFFPTDPGQSKLDREAADTDRDSIFDSYEASAFIFGEPKDDGSRCIRGGGLNPHTVDTDQDAIPDAWEMQYSGTPVEIASANPEDIHSIADGIAKGAAGAGVYLANGMDGTWRGDAYTDPLPPEEKTDPEDMMQAHSYDPLLGTVRDVDFDRDGLENYQEYLVQTLRHLRWDDITTPLMGRVLFEGAPNHYQSFLGFVPMMQNANNFAVNAALALYGLEGIRVTTETNGVNVVVDASGNTITNYLTTVVSNVANTATAVKERQGYTGTYVRPWNQTGWGWVGYMTLPVKSWDRSLTDIELPSPYFLLPPTRQEMEGVRTFAKYVSTDPRLWDTDGDGMGDYYELFHGLNPLLGSIAGQGSKDVIAEAYSVPQKFNAAFNEWTNNDFLRDDALDPDPGKIPSAYPQIAAPMLHDVMIYPWFAGALESDPDGDGLNNYEEMVKANLTSPAPTHTDPTPRWFTNPHLQMSFVNMYYRAYEPLRNVNSPASELPFKIAAFSIADEMYNNSVMGSMREDAAAPQAEYMFSFEENEGYDTDNDWIPDGREIVKTVKAYTDPLDFTDPNRRQAAYFDGVNSFMMTKMQPYRGSFAVDMLKQFTVEAWVRPEGISPEGQTIVDRVCAYGGNSILNYGITLRSNFRLGIDNAGRVYGIFDNSDAVESGVNEPVSCQRVTGQKLEIGKWAHVAMTYTGSKLTLYVNGKIADSAETTLIPANGVLYIEQDVSQPLISGLYEFVPAAFYVGARPSLQAAPRDRVKPLTIAEVQYGQMQEFFNGYVDEVRVWDGARTSAQIIEDYKKRYSSADAAENRLEVYQAWINGGTRNNNVSAITLPPELLMHYGFNTLPGAVKSTDVIKSPTGYTKAVIGAIAADYESDSVQRGDFDQTGRYSISNPEMGTIIDIRRNLKGGDWGTYKINPDWDLSSGWWGSCQTRSLVYTDYSVVPWVKNTVAHLKAMDGSTIDSQYYAEKLGGIYSPVSNTALTGFVFPNSALPYSEYYYNTDRYTRLFRLKRLVEMTDASNQPHLDLYKFEIFSRMVGSSDLLPMGNAYARRCEKLWDDYPSDAWEYSVRDDNANGISDWWEEYAKDNYQGIAWDQEVNWDSLITYFGVEMSAYQAFLIDLARGLQPDGQILSEFASTADEDGDNLPDWWETLFDVKGGADDDPDNDGLTNYQEYLISFGAYPYGFMKATATGWEKNDFPLLHPNKSRSQKDQKVTDFYLSGPSYDIDAAGRHISGNSYVGQIVNDIDNMEDWWEKKYNVDFASTSKYDPDLDKDDDGWSNYAEARSFMWKGSYTADLIESYIDTTEQVKCHPTPSIGLKITYYGLQNISGAQIVAKTYASYSKTADATFVAPVATAGESKIVGGYYANNVLKGQINPGSLTPGSVHLASTQMSFENKIYRWEVPMPGADADAADIVVVRTGTYKQFLEELLYYPDAKLLEDVISWDQLASSTSDADGQKGDLIYSGTNSLATAAKKVGSINYRTGEYEIDLASLELANGGSLEGMLFRLDYNFRRPDEYPQVLWFSSPAAGRVKEGLNTIEVFADLDGNGSFAAGIEPYGVIQNVNIGWHKTQELVVELKDESSVLERLAVGSGAAANGAADAQQAQNQSLTTKILLKRVAINGQRVINGKTVPERILLTKNVHNTDRPFITESDILSAVSYDLDWKRLRKDANKLGITDEMLAGATYEYVTSQVMSDGSVTNEVLGTFENTFLAQRSVPVAREPVSGAPVYSASPKLAFGLGDETMKAYRLQISTSTNATDVIYDSGIKLLPGRTGYTAGVNVYEVSPEFYWNCAVSTNGSYFVNDASNYYWRVVAFNSKFNEVASDSDWSKWAAFQMDVGNANRYPNLPTGYGFCSATVRYYGPAVTNDLSNAVVVEAYESADFTGQCVDRKRIVDFDAATLSSRSEIASQDVKLGGIRPGKVYLKAYLDLNNNARHDKFEPWGYANKVGTDSIDMYTPVSVDITDEINSYENLLIFINDTDVNRNEIPDCVEPEFFVSESTEVVENVNDTDGDGMSDVDEESFGTDPSIWDSDGDGMPDGWEGLFADMDPLYADGEEAAAEDVMAFASMDAKLVTVKSNAPDASPETYILKTGAAIPYGGDLAAGLEVYKSFEYPVYENGEIVKYIGRGGLTTIENPAPVEVVEGTTTTTIQYVKRVISVTDAKVALVHAQVYAEYGFNQLTAVSSTNAVNTKAFTALDKYLLIRYFDSLGICKEGEVNILNAWPKYSLLPYNTDCDEDGVPDGWELYVMFGKNEMNLDNFTNGTALSCWKFADREGDSDGDGLGLVYEFDRGSTPSDPWNEHTFSSAFSDYEAQKYALKTYADQMSDFDNDGLSNIQEYKALSHGLDLDVRKLKTDDVNNDYFRQVSLGGNMHYIGEVVADHDLMEDYLETDFLFDRSVYDATKDADKDGWSNWAELRSYLDVGEAIVPEVISNKVVRSNLSSEDYDYILNNYEVLEDKVTVSTSMDAAGNWTSQISGSITYIDTQTVMRTQSLYTGVPYPTVKVTIAYNGEKDIDAGAFVIEAYSSSSMQKKLCTWSVAAGDYVATMAHNGYLTLELKEPLHGYLKEGDTHFAVFADMNSDGVYNPAEPFGIVKDIPVGFASCTPFAVELKDVSSVVPRISLVEQIADRVVLEGTSTNTSNVTWGQVVSADPAAGGASDVLGGAMIDGEQFRVRVIRTEINGDSSAKKRTLLNRVFTLANRNYLHEGDFFTALKNDIDPYLAADAKLLGIAPAAVASATYEIVLGEAQYKAGVTNENVYATFINDYPSTRATGTPLAPSANSRGVVTTARPVLEFSADTSAYTAYAVQVAADQNFGNVLYASTNLLSGAVKGVVTHECEYFAADGGTYYWRVALFNSKFNTLDKLSSTDAVWSDPVVFTTELKGEATADVKYFGPADTSSKIVTQAFVSPDFAGVPAACVKAGSLGDNTLKGLKSGKYYLLAFIDRNADGIRQSYESWGYACKVGGKETDIYTPVAVEINADVVTDAVRAEIYIEDTDINQNFVVDVLDSEDDLKAAEEAITSESEDDSAGNTSDADGDGLKAYEEDEIGTDPESVDTDGDGMWDGWEVWAGTDPLDPEDAAFAVDGDVMAYKEVKMALVKTRSTLTGTEEIYIVPEGAEVPVVGDNVNKKKFAAAFEYGSANVYGIGGEVEIPSTAKYNLVTVSNTTDSVSGTFLFDYDAALAAGANVTSRSAYEVLGPDASNVYTLGAVTNLVVDPTIIEPTSSNVVTAVSIVDVSLGENRVVSVEDVNVALIHNQLYQKFGFNSKTAVAALDEADRVNTKAFTALDKYLLIRYFDSLGICDEKTVNAECRWAEYSLKPGVVDGDWSDAEGNYGDGIPDGWELYVGTNPWNFADRENDSDADGLKLYEEFDRGNGPTNPNAVDTNGDGILDKYEYLYNLKNGNGALDNDGDGLSNYAEYLISEVFAYAKLDPNNAKTNGYIPDYFRKAGNMYVGEIFTDHDKVGDDWERSFVKANIDGKLYANPGVYDPNIDIDNDGWSNYAEFRSLTDPDSEATSGIDGFVLSQKPTPIIEVNLVYNGAKQLNGSIQFKAWNQAEDKDMTKKPCAVWTVGKMVNTTITTGAGTQQGMQVEVSRKYIGLNPRKVKTFHLGPGVVQNGTFRLMFKDKGFVWGDIVGEYFVPNSIGLVEDALWYNNVVDKEGKLVTLGGELAGEVEVGTIDYKTGMVTIDFSNPALNEFWVGDPSIGENLNDNGNSNNSNNNNQNRYQSIMLNQSYVTIEWQSKSVSADATGMYYLSDCDVGYRGLLEGKTTFTAEFVAGGSTSAAGGSGSGAAQGGTSAQKIFGVARDVDVTWSGARVTIELTDYNPVTPRIDLAAGTVDRVTLLTNAYDHADTRYNTATNTIADAVLGSEPVRVRVVRFSMNGYPWYVFEPKLVDVGGYQYEYAHEMVQPRVVMDKIFDPNGRTMLTEADFLGDGQFDIDFADFRSEVLLNKAVCELLGNTLSDANMNLTNVCYAIVIGDDKKIAFEGVADDKPLNASTYFISRRFDRVCATPVIAGATEIAYGARPTFVWSMPGESAWASQFGSSYTAFRIEIVDERDNLVWDSGVRRAPSMNSQKQFVWTADLAAGSLTALGRMFECSGAYKWRVQMLNSKFSDSASAKWSEYASLIPMVNTAQEVNDHGFSSIKVAVKYSGPAVVLEKYKALSPKGAVIVQAFATAGFAGDPEAQSIVTNAVDALEDNLPNAVLRGLPAAGSYYIRAFIDSNGNGKCDEFESWGYVPEAVDLDTSLLKAPVVGVWIDDSDTDGDWLPDAYEYAVANWNGEWVDVRTLRGANKAADGELALPENFLTITNKIASGEFDAGISTGLPGASLTVFQGSDFAAALVGIDVANKSSIAALREAIEKKVKTVKVTSITLDAANNSIRLTVNGDVATSIAGQMLNKFYTVAGAVDYAEVTLKLYRKTNLAQADWELVSEKNVRIGTGDVVVVQQISSAEADLKSGFFKVEVVQ